MLIRRLKVIAALWLTAALALSLSMCAGSDAKKPPVEEGIAKLIITASPQKIAANGATTDITVLATLADGTSAGGTATIQVSNGTLNGAGSSFSGTLANGRATAKWGCDEKVNPACRGNHTATVTWSDKTASTTVEFTAPDVTPTDDGGVDSSTIDAAKDSAADTGVDSAADTGVDSAADTGVDSAVVDAATVGTLTLVPSKAKIYLGTPDLATMTATLKQADGGAIANEELSFATNLGTVALADGGAPVVNTASNGTAQAVLKGAASAGVATVTVTRTSTSQTAQANVTIEAANSITFQQTKCGNVACSIMGIKNSGFNEIANVSFRVADSSNVPVPGITVTFSINNTPLGTQVIASAVTDSNGIATAVVTSGTVIGSFEITASIETPSGTKSVQSTTIGIRGAIPSNKNFSFTCVRFNANAYDSPSPPLKIDIDCNVKLVDRFNNPVGTGTSVNFKAEAGSIPNSALTQVYVPNTANSAEGTAKVTFSTLGSFPAEDTTPLVAIPAQYPNARALEPSYADGQLTRNPRDGLVTILAYVQGEEDYKDDNNNGQRDSGEQFIDQGEPLVDRDDDGVFDPGEDYIDLNNNNMWDGPNSVWDGDTTVWAVAHVLYTSVPSATNSFITPSNFGTVALGATKSFAAYFRDINMNYITSQAVLSMEFINTRSVTPVITQGLVDRFGFGISRILVASPGEGQCTGGTPICKHKVVFTQWSPDTAESAVTAQVVNPNNGSPPGGSATFRFKATLAGVTLPLESTGALAP